MYELWIGGAQLGFSSFLSFAVRNLACLRIRRRILSHSRKRGSRYWCSCRTMKCSVGIRNDNLGDVFKNHNDLHLFANQSFLTDNTMLHFIWFLCYVISVLLMNPIPDRGPHTRPTLSLSSSPLRDHSSSLTLCHHFKSQIKHQHGIRGRRDC